MFGVSLASFEIIEELFRSQTVIVAKAHWRGQQDPVIIKFPCKSEDSERLAAYLRHEYHTLRLFSDDNVIKALGFVEDGDVPVLITENCVGFTDLSFLIQIWRKHDSWPLDKRIELGFLLIQSVLRVHAEGIIHKDIKPANFLIASEPMSVKIIDFDLSAPFAIHEPGQMVNHKLVGSLPYIAPEQTGRINRQVDSRADLYSLGVTLYQLLSLELPLFANDSIGWTYQHITVRPPSLSTIVADIPPMISWIVDRLLKKNPDKRYQSIQGLYHDYGRCVQALQASVDVDSFVLGRADFSADLKFPEQIYGREEDLEKLDRLFRKTQLGEQSLLLLSGEAGVGKSTLIGQIQKTVIKNQGFFLQGKYDQLTRSDPLTGFIDAFSSWFESILLCSEKDFSNWQKVLNDRLGFLADVLVNLIPNSSAILKHTDEILQLDATGAEQRLISAFEILVEVIARSERPLVIFLDDMQWADIMSFSLLKNIIFDRALGKVFLIITFRDTEVDAMHPLRSTIQEIEASEVNVVRIHLQNLEVGDIDSLLEDMTNRKTGTLGLATTLKSKTMGNPFLMKEFLKQLYSEKLFFFDYETRVWQWQIDMISKKPPVADVIELILKNISKLPEKTREILGIASCFGRQYDLWYLANVIEQDLITVAKALWPAVNNGLVDVMSEGHKLVLEMVAEDTVDIGIRAENRFVHDRVQQAAYQTLDPRQAMSIHLGIGRIMLRHVDLSSDHQMLFYVASQFVLALSLITDEDEKLEVASLLYDAARKAKDSGAASTASEYADAAISLLPQESWQTQYELSLGLYSQACEVARLADDGEKLERYRQFVLENAATDFDKIQVQANKIEWFNMKNRGDAAVDLGVSVLNTLGQKIAAKPSILTVLLSFFTTRRSIGNKTPTEILNLPLKTDPLELAALDIFSSLATAAYFTRPILLPLLICKMVQMEEKTISPNAGFNYVSFGLLIGPFFGKEYKKGYKYGCIGLEIAKKFPQNRTVGRAKLAFGIHLQPYCESFTEMHEFLRQVPQDTRHYGDIEYYAYCYLVTVTWGLHSGKNLKDLSEMIPEHAAYYEAKGQLTTALLASIYHQLFSCLADPNVSDSLSLSGDYCEESSVTSSAIDRNMDTSISYLLGLKFFLGSVFVDYDQAFIFYKKWKKYRNSEFLDRRMNFDLALACIRRLEGSFWKNLYLVPKAWLATRKIRNFAKLNPRIFGNKLHLLKAEWAGLFGRIPQAADNYEKAIFAADKEGFLHEAGIGYELYGRFLLRIRAKQSAEDCFRKAFNCFRLWGADNKLQAMLRQYPFLQEDSDSTVPLSLRRASDKRHPDIIEAQESKSSQKNLSEYSLDTIKTSYGHEGFIGDFESILKLNQAISGEIDLERLLDRMIAISVENSGALRAVLILRLHGEHKVVAKLEQNEARIMLTEPAVFNEYLGCCHGVVFACLRAKSPIITGAAMDDHRFAADDYVVVNQIRSILCIPLVNQGKVLGCIYLENGESSYVFSGKQLNFMRIVAGQAAISIDNAFLYQKIADHLAKVEFEVAEKTREVRAILQNIQQGIFMLMPGRKIHRNYSSFLSEIFKVDNLTLVRDALDLLFQKSNIGFDKLEVVKGTVNSILGSSEFNAFLNIKNLPKEVFRDDRHLEIDWVPMVVDGIVTQILVSIRDVSDRRHLESETARQKVEMAMIEQLLPLKLQQYHSFRAQVAECLRENRRLIRLDTDSGLTDSDETLGKLLLNLHTVKGSGRSLGLLFINDIVHSFEEFCVNLREAKLPLDTQQLLARCEEVSAIMAQYDYLMVDKLMRREDQSGSVGSNVELYPVLQELKESLENQDLVRLSDGLCLLEDNICAHSNDIIGDIYRIANDVAKTLGKTMPRISLSSIALDLDDDDTQLLEMVFLHLVRNALDHGIESDAERSLKGKGPRGTINLNIFRREADLVFQFSDDGRGLDLDVIRTIGLDKNLIDGEVIDPMVIKELIFHSGFSTSEQVTDISGRGVGMHAVRSLLEKSKGSIDIVLQGAVYSHYIFYYEISLSSRFIIAETA